MSGATPNAAISGPRQALFFSFSTTLIFGPFVLHVIDHRRAYAKFRSDLRAAHSFGEHRQYLFLLIVVQVRLPPSRLPPPLDLRLLSTVPFARRRFH